MSSSSISSSLRLSGLSSGLDVDSIVKNLMTAESMKEDKIKQDRQTLAWQQEDYRTMNTALRSFRDNVFDMKMQATYLTHKTSSSNESVAKVTASTLAVEGVYTLNKITQLASGASITSDEVTQTATGSTKMSELGLGADISVTIANGTKNATLQIKPDDTISTLVNNINSLKDANGNSLGIKVSYDDNLHRFFMMTTGTGVTQEIKLTGDTDFLENRLKISTTPVHGQNAIVDLNGIENLEFDSNKFTVSGVTYDLQGTSDTATTITVSRDTDAVLNKIKDFVNSYNDTISKVNTELNEDRYTDYLPLTDDQKEALSQTQQDQWEAKARSGLLRNDTLLESVITKMRSTLSSSVTGMGSSKYTTLSSIGITTGTYSEKGKLYIDEKKMKEALDNDPDAVMKLFTNSSDNASEKGLAMSLYDNVNNAITSISSKAGSADSLVDSSYIGERLKEFDGQIVDWDSRLSAIEDSYYRKFSAMEQAISKMNSQSTWLAQQFSS